MRRGFMYLVAVMDWYSRKVLSWRFANTLDSNFCFEALQADLQRYGQPDIFNTPLTLIPHLVVAFSFCSAKLSTATLCFMEQMKPALPLHNPY
jgi:transposase InsO family protein